MSAREPENAVLMRRQGKTLVPTDAMGEELIDKLKPGDEVMVWVKKARNPKLLRKLQAMYTVIFRNQSKYPSRDVLVDVMKCAVGHCTMFITERGQSMMVPRSIAEDKLGGIEFEEFCERTFDYVVTRFIPGLRRSELRRELEKFCGVEVPPDRAPPSHESEERARD